VQKIRNQKFSAIFKKSKVNILLEAEVKVSRNDLERGSGKRIIAGTAFRLEFLVGWCYDADATMAVPELYWEQLLHLIS